MNNCRLVFRFVFLTGIAAGFDSKTAWGDRHPPHNTTCRLATRQYHLRLGWLVPLPGPMRALASVSIPAGVRQSHPGWWPSLRHRAFGQAFGEREETRDQTTDWQRYNYRKRFRRRQLLWWDAEVARETCQTFVGRHAIDHIGYVAENHILGDVHTASMLYVRCGCPSGAHRNAQIGRSSSPRCTVDLLAVASQPLGLYSGQFHSVEQRHSGADRCRWR